MLLAGGEDGGGVDARPAAEEALIFGIAVERRRVFEHEASARDVLFAIKLAVELRAAVCVLVCLVVALWRNDGVVGQVAGIIAEVMLPIERDAD